MAKLSLTQYMKKPATTGMAASSTTPKLRDYDQPVVREDPPSFIPTEQSPQPLPTPVPGGKDTIGPVIRGPGTFDASPVGNTPIEPKVPVTTGPVIREPGVFQGSPIPPPTANTKPPTTTGPLNPTTPPITGTPTGQPALGDFFREVQQKELVATQLNNLLDSDSRYIQNARRRGTEQAASRGLLNSSASAGAAERAAIEAGMGIATADANAYRSSGDQNFAALNQLRQMRTSAELQDWSNNQQFNREFNAGLSMMPIQNATQMWNAIMQRGLDDPAVFTPEVMQNLSDFYNLNFDVMMKRYLGGG